MGPQGGAQPRGVRSACLGAGAPQRFKGAVPLLIPGNVPNIIWANKLGITSKEWARFGVPLGLLVMLAYFVWLFYL